MEGRYNDGRTSRVLLVEVRIEDAALLFDADGEHRWPLAELEAETVDDRVRLSRRGGGAERLGLSLADWQAFADHDAHARAGRRRGVQLVLALAGAGAAAAALVFFGVPAASGPLAAATPPALETKIGRNFETQLSLAFRRCSGADGQTALKGLGERLQQASATPFPLRVQAVEAPMVNAFALPGGAIMVTDDLIAMTRTPDELAAVIAHEAAHVQKRHVMQAVWRSFGFGLLLDAVVGGGSGAGQQAVLLLGSFTNLRFGREAEADADAAGQALLGKLGLSSQGMAPFFRRLASRQDGPQAAAVKELLSDHPDTLRRAAASQARARPGAPAFSAGQWRAIKAACAAPARSSKRS